MKPQTFLVFGLALVLLGLCRPGNAQDREASDDAPPEISEVVENAVEDADEALVEQELAVRACDESEFQCADKTQCVPESYVCDGDKDCADGSDDEAEMCHDKCTSIKDRFQCKDLTCVRSVHACNGVIQCPDGSDEDGELCANCNGDEGRTKCGNSSKCVPKSYFCDGDMDCGEDDPTDEDPSVCAENCAGYEDRFQCADKSCIQNSLVCGGGEPNCKDGSDETEELCKTCNGVEGRKTCPGSTKCIPSTYFCDGDNDCGNREDEQNCPGKEAEEEE